MINDKVYFSGKYVQLSQIVAIDINEPKIITKQIYITSYEHQTVVLPCEVENLPQYMSIIWQYGKRNENNQTVLTVGATQVENNYRMRLITNISANDQGLFGKNVIYNLEIRKVIFEDSGWYECQLPTKPTKINYIHLQVLSMPRIEVSSKAAGIGESFELICQVKNMPRDYQLGWYLNGKKISMSEKEKTKVFRNRRGHLANWFDHEFLLFRDTSDAVPVLRIKEEKFKNYTISRLKIDKINEFHQGVFKCKYDKIEAKYFLDLKLNSKKIIKALDQVGACGTRLDQNSVPILLTLFILILF